MPSKLHIMLVRTRAMEGGSVTSFRKAASDKLILTRDNTTVEALIFWKMRLYMYILKCMLTSLGLTVSG